MADLPEVGSAVLGDEDALMGAIVLGGPGISSDEEEPTEPEEHFDLEYRDFKSLSKAEIKEYKATILQSHASFCEVKVLDGNEHVINNLSWPIQRLMNGQVDVDTTSPKDTVTRTFSCEILDPRQKLDFDPHGKNGLWYDTFIEAARLVVVQSIDTIVRVPIFMGPISRFERNEFSVTIEALGKEALAMEPFTVWKPLKFPRGTKVTTVIREIMQGQGESRFNFPKLKAKTTERISVARGQEAWKRCQKLANSINRQLYYDARGVLNLRRHPQSIVWDFEYGSNMYTVPVHSHDALTELVNVVVVKGAKPTHGNDKISAVAMPPNAHPLSPERLSRRGTPRYSVELIENDQIKRTAEAERLAQDTLDRRLKLVLTGEFEAICAPHLDESDTISIKAPGQQLHVPLQRWSVPLTGGTMTIGINKKKPATHKHKHKGKGQR